MDYDKIIKASGRNKEWALAGQIHCPVEALAAVKEDGYALRYVQSQTEAICLEAVKEDGDALQYVRGLS